MPVDEACDFASLIKTYLRARRGLKGTIQCVHVGKEAAFG